MEVVLSNYTRHTHTHIHACTAFDSDGLAVPTFKKLDELRAFRLNKRDTRENFSPSLRC